MGLGEGDTAGNDRGLEVMGGGGGRGSRAFK